MRLELVACKSTNHEQISESTKGYRFKIKANQASKRLDISNGRRLKGNDHTDSNSKVYIMDTPYETLKSVTALKQIAQFGRRACNDKDYNGSEYFHRIVEFLDDLQWEIDESIPEWEKIMGVK